MAHIASIANVGDKLVVGQVDTSFLTGTSRVTPGTVVLNGPVYIGATPQIGVARATCMIGPPLPGLALPASLEVLGISNINGVTNVLGNLNVAAVSNFTGTITVNAIAIKNGLDLKNSQNISNSNSIANGPVNINGPLNVTQIITTPKIIASYGAFSSVAAPFKKFDIPHPNKSGMRLRHACLEGPEIGVYCRGRLLGNDVIDLPEYWRGLVNYDTITVHLTSHNKFQKLYVLGMERNNNSIVISNHSFNSIDCSYIVYAERIDVNKLEVEYTSEEMI